MLGNLLYTLPQNLLPTKNLKREVKEEDVFLHLSSFINVSIMKWSLYNEIIDSSYNKDIAYIYNIRYDLVYTIDRTLVAILQKYHKNIENLENIHPDFYRSMIDNKLIVENNIDEYQECLNDITTRLKSDKSVRITVNPTLDCNLKCWYCYENHTKGSFINQDIINRICLYLQNVISSPTNEKVQLSFFGGEPLLCFSRCMKPLIDRFNTICSCHKKQLSFSITTNGVCLTKNTVDELLSYGQKVYIQVAFDGNREAHNKIKFLKSGEGVYDIVRNNLYYALEKGLIVTIRCNYDAMTILSFINLLEDFQNYWNFPNLRFDFHRIWQTDVDNKLFERLAKFKESVKGFNFKSNLPTYRGNSATYCACDYDNNFIFNYDGNIYKCTARDFTSENKIGFLDLDGNIIITANKTFEKFTEECTHCRFLPLCTICTKVRSESKNGKCPGIDSKAENISLNIRKHFYDKFILPNKLNI